MDKTGFRNNYVWGNNSTTLVFMNNTNVPVDTTGCLPEDIIDVSEKQNGSIMMSIDTNDCQFDDVTIYVGQSGGVLAPPDSSRLFSTLDSNINFTNLDTSHVTEMYLMFEGLNEWSNIGSLNTSNVTSMSWLFHNAGDCNNPGTKNIDLSGWNTSKVVYMNSMFDNSCFNIVNLSTFNTSRVTTMNQMFVASPISTIIVSNNFVTTALVDAGVINGGDYGMFEGAYNLVGGNGTHYNSNHTDSLYARIDAAGTPGYFTAVS